MTATDHRPDAGSALETTGKERRSRLRALVESGSPDAPGAIVSAGSDPDPLVRAEAAYQLAHTRHPQAAAFLETLSADTAPAVRAIVVEALAELGGDAGRTRILAFAVGDASEDVRGAAVRALATLGGPDAVRALEKLAQDPVPVVRDRAAEAIARLRAAP